MNKIDTEKLKKNISIKTLIETETGLKFDKLKRLSKCPFCGSGNGEKGSPALSIKLSDNIFNCFSCGNKGNPIDFIVKYKKLLNGEAIKYLQSNYKFTQTIAKSEPEPKTDIGKKVYAIKQNDKTKASEYLQKHRGINVGKLPQNAYYYDKFSNAVVIIYLS